MRYVRRNFALLAGLSMSGVVATGLAQSPGHFPGASPPLQESYAAWLVRCLGLFGFMTLLTGAAVFLGACFVVFLARRPAVIAAYMVFLLLPLLLGILGGSTAVVSMFGSLARSGARPPRRKSVVAWQKL